MIERLGAGQSRPTLGDFTGEVSFYVVSLGYILLLISLSFDYTPEARLLPIFIGSLLVIGISTKLVLLLAGDRIPLRTSGLFNDMTAQYEEYVGPREEHPDLRTSLVTLVWIGLLVIAIWVFGFLLAATLYTPLFVYYHTRDLRDSVVTTVVLVTVIYVLFIGILSSPLWRGLLFS